MIFIYFILFNSFWYNQEHNNNNNGRLYWYRIPNVTQSPLG